MDPGLGRLFKPIDVGSYTKVKGNFPIYLALLMLGLVFGGAIEELLFRGFVIGWGAVLFGERATIPLFLLSSAVFGLGHLYQGWSGVISTGASGLLFGALYLASGRKLLPAMLAHMTLDAIGITALYLGYAA
jgi:membrane protease YdiL (CAAX protease family)